MKKVGSSDNLPSNPKDWRKWKDENKALKRKWKEEKVMKQLQKEKEKKQKVEETSKETGRQYTVSIALPGSILDNAQSPELQTYLAGQIARAAVVFNVDEIVVFDESGSNVNDFSSVADGRRGYCNIHLAHLLQYLECPQYLRKKFFPIHKNLQYVGLLNPLDCPSHPREEDWSPYREGVVLDKPAKEGRGSYAYVGLKKDVQIDRRVDPGLRITVAMDQDNQGRSLRGRVVDNSTPVRQSGLYWGYTVRLAARLSDVISKCPYSEGYDITVGTSQTGQSVDNFRLPQFKHLLLVFGGLQGLEYSIDNDDQVKVNDPKELFDYYINSCPQQGSHTIRTEEAVLVTLSTLRPQIQQNVTTH